MWKENRVAALLHTRYPVIQAGMIWASGWRLASVISNTGGLGVIGSGSMYPHILEEHLNKMKDATDKPFAVNLPILYADVKSHLEIIIRHKVKVVITSAGNPALYTPLLKDHGIKVLHVVASKKFAVKSQSAGCDAVIAEGVEAGGHNGREETTTFVLVPLVKAAVDIPVIAAGGIATGRQMLAAMILGAEGVQIGSRFVASEEASSHINFKKAIIQSSDGDTTLALKEIVPVRIMKNEFYAQVAEACRKCATREELIRLVGRARPKRGMFEGDLTEGELQIGQVSALIHDIKPAAQILEEILDEFYQCVTDIKKW